MFKIQKKNIEILDEARLEEFLNRIVSHWTKSFPERFQKSPEEKIRLYAQSGYEEAVENGNSSERGIMTYLDLALVRGIGFARSIPDNPPDHETSHNAQTPSRL